MKTLFSFLLVCVAFINANSQHAIVCYDYPTNNNCFYTNYDCGDLDCTQTSTPCWCLELDISTIYDMDEDKYYFRIVEDDLFQIRHNEEPSWTSIVNLGTIMDLDEEVFDVILYSCSEDKLTFKRYDEPCLAEGGTPANCYLGHHSVYYVCH